MTDQNTAAPSADDLVAEADTGARNPSAAWQAKLPGGKNGGGPIEHLKDVIIEDSLGICEELDRRMNHLVETYHDEWVRSDPKAGFP